MKYTYLNNISLCYFVYTIYEQITKAMSIIICQYNLCDIQVALRWRTEKEVIAGKGQFECGNKICNEKENLRSWELNFGYVEHGEKKNALVKLSMLLIFKKSYVIKDFYKIMMYFYIKGFVQNVR